MWDCPSIQDDRRQTNNVVSRTVLGKATTTTQSATRYGRQTAATAPVADAAPPRNQTPRPGENRRDEDEGPEVAPPLDTPKFCDYQSDAVHEYMSLKEALRVTADRLWTSRPHTEEYKATEAFHGMQQILLPGRRSHEEDQDAHDPEDARPHRARGRARRLAIPRTVELPP